MGLKLMKFFGNHKHMKRKKNLIDFLQMPFTSFPPSFNSIEIHCKLSKGQNWEVGLY